MWILSFNKPEGNSTQQTTFDFCRQYSLKSDWCRQKCVELTCSSICLIFTEAISVAMLEKCSVNTRKEKELFRVTPIWKVGNDRMKSRKK